MFECFPFQKWDFQNKTGIGSRFKALAIVNDFSKPNWIWFGIFRTLTMVIKIFQTNLNLVWNLRLAKSIFFFPNQTGLGLENRMQFLGVTFPNQTGFGLEKDTEWNVAALHYIFFWLQPYGIYYAPLLAFFTGVIVFICGNLRYTFSIVILSWCSTWSPSSWS